MAKQDPDNIEHLLVGESKARDGFIDPTNNFPRSQYTDHPSTNKTVRRIDINELYVGGGYSGIDLDLTELKHSRYPDNQVNETTAGHITEIDNTEGNERLLWKHKTGTGIDCRPDGTIIISSTHNRVTVTGGDEKIIVEGNGEIVYLGNLKLTVAGDMDVEVGGDYNLRVNGNKNENIHGHSSTHISENKVEQISGNSATFVTGTNTDTFLEHNNLIVKGTHTERVQAHHNTFVGGNSLHTADGSNGIGMTAENINIGGRDVSIMMDKGQVGGENVIYYAKNYYGTSGKFTEGVTAPTFHGDLNGVAATSRVTRSQSYGENSTGSAGAGITNTATNTTTRIIAPGPRADEMESYLKSDFGVRKVNIDPGDVLKGTIDKSASYGGVSKHGLTTTRLRSLLRDPKTVRNQTLIGRALSEDIISSSFINPKPEQFEIGRIVNSTGSGKYPAGLKLGNEKIPVEKIKTESGTIVVNTFIPDQAYNPEVQFANTGIINGKTKLGKGITLAKFLGGHGDPITLDHITDDIERLKVARNLYAHAEFMKSVHSYLEPLNEFRFVVAEGLYKKQPDETLDPDSLNYLATRGQVVVYEVYNRKGQIDHEKTFDLALYCKDYINYDKMILDYDSYNPDNTLNAQLIIQMPPVNADWRMRFRNQIETRYNNYTQTFGELVEIL